MSTSQHVHRSGPLKQQNKSHKSKHSTKGELKKKTKGKVERQTLKSTAKISAAANKEQRKLQQKQKQRAKRDAILHERRIGTREGPPKIVSILSLSNAANTKTILHTIANCQNGIETDKMDDAFDIPDTGAPITVNIAEFKLRLTLFESKRNVQHVLDTAKISDIILLVIQAEQGIDEDGYLFLSLLRSQGFPSVIVVIQGLEQVANQKRYKEIKKEYETWIKKEFADPEPRMVLCDSAKDAKTLVRWINEQKVRTIHWRESHPYMLADKWQFLPNPQPQQQQQQQFASLVANQQPTGSLAISGYLRGQPLAANQLIVSEQDPHRTSKKSNTAMEEELETIIRKPDHNQESLQSEIIPDPMANDQVMPTEEDFEIAKQKIVKKKVPKGFSAYQAAWIPDDDEALVDEEDEEDDDDDENDNQDDQSMKDDEAQEATDATTKGPFKKESDFDMLTVSEAPKQFDMEDDEMMTEEERKAQYEKFLNMKKESADDLEYPDEVEAPHDIPARVRFQKYRGLKSFRDSPWDPKESLPLDYARIFQFENFTRSQKLALRPLPDAVEEDRYYTITLRKVPVAAMELFVKGDNKLLQLFGLHRHEQRMSVLNLQLKKDDSYPHPIKNKEELIVQIGFRTFLCNPVLSDYNPRFDKHKLERFLQFGRIYAATIYAPVTYKPAPVLVFKKNNLSKHGVELIATGSVDGVNPDRIILKKCVLTASPYKIHKKQGIARFMFHNPEDVRWFKPIELHTKRGRRGVIKEPVGTHGYMKCVFDDNVAGDDTICMNLYKRVFPKWTTEEITLTNQK